jgi:hypothetical protein
MRQRQDDVTRCSRIRWAYVECLFDYGCTHLLRQEGVDFHSEDMRKREKSRRLRRPRFLEFTISFSGTYTPLR